MNAAGRTALEGALRLRLLAQATLSAKVFSEFKLGFEEFKPDGGLEHDRRVI